MPKDNGGGAQLALRRSSTCQQHLQLSTCMHIVPSADNVLRHTFLCKLSLPMTLIIIEFTKFTIIY